MFIRRIKLENLLSFGPNTEELELAPLNILIGPNGSGKSNLIEAIGLLKATPRDLTAPIREGGGIRDWIWRGEPKVSSAYIEVILDNPKGAALRYCLGFAEKGQRFELTDERIENEEAYSNHSTPYLYYELQGGRATLNDRGEDVASVTSGRDGSTAIHSRAAKRSRPLSGSDVARRGV